MMLSIALTTFNGEKFIKDQLDSILHQSLSNWELIICDDNSTDQTFNILEKYQKRDSRIKLYKNRANIGFIKNFEQAISLCSGDYIALCDQDDIWLPNHLETLYQEIKEYDCACTNASLINQNGESLNMTMRDFIPVHIIPKNKDSFFIHELYGNIIQSAACMFSRNLISDILPFPQFITYHDWWIALIACEKSGCKYIDKITTQYRRHESNTTTIPKTGFFKSISFFWKNSVKLKESYRKHLEMLNHLEKTTSSKEQLHKLQEAEKFYNALLFKEHRLWAILHYIKNYNIIQLSYRRNIFRFMYRIFCLIMGVKW